MSDSGRQAGDCPHGGASERWCCYCLREQIAELEASFDLRNKADMRAIKRWQKENPKERKPIWPDHADLVCWLLGQLELKEKQSAD